MPENKEIGGRQAGESQLSEKMMEGFAGHRRGRAALVGPQSRSVSAEPRRNQLRTPENQGFQSFRPTDISDLRLQINYHR
jgi:hypothetical protein